MPIVIQAKGDLLFQFKAGQFSAIAHGCNCFHTMGAGIADQIRRQFPEAFEADLTTIRGNSYKLGTFTEAKTEFGTVFNLYTQYRPGVENPKLLNRSIQECFRKLDTKVGGDVRYLLGIPKIGAGLAGGDWNYISELINEATPRLNICVVEYQP